MICHRLDSLPGHRPQHIALPPTGALAHRSSDCRRQPRSRKPLLAPRERHMDSAEPRSQREPGPQEPESPGCSEALGLTNISSARSQSTLGKGASDICPNPSHKACLAVGNYKQLGSKPMPQEVPNHWMQGLNLDSHSLSLPQCLASGNSTKHLLSCSCVPRRPLHSPCGDRSPRPGLMSREALEPWSGDPTPQPSGSPELRTC